MKDRDIEAVLDIFEKHYVLVPLEVFDDPFEILISTLMSSRTNDDTTRPAAERLFAVANTPEKMLTLSEEEIEKLIFPVGFYKTKARNIKKLSKILLDEYEGSVPSTREQLMRLPGVGRKTANLTMNRAFGAPAIAVDTHVHKISNLLGWVKTDKPEETEIALMKVLPQKYWAKMNILFVSIGRQFTTKEKLVEFLEMNGLVG